MPFIETKTNVKITEEKEKRIKELLGEAISIIPGKSERWLMLNFKDNQRMYFAGESSPVCYAEVNLFGKASGEALEALTKRLCEIYESELGVSPGNTYVKYEEVDNWGWNGGNF